MDVAFIFDFIGIVDATSADCCEVVGIDENAENIATITALVEDNSADIKENTALIETNAVDIKDNTALIEANTDDIQTNLDDIQTNAANLAKATRCSAINWEYGCCTPDEPCTINQGGCDSDEDCHGDLKCGTDNCKGFTDSGKENYFYVNNLFSL